MTESVVGSSQAQIVQIESLLHSFSTAHANDNVASRRRLDRRPVVAACLAFFVFAPGCAAAAAFLLRSDGTLPPLVMAHNDAPAVVKSDRLPLDQWSSEASTRLEAQQELRAANATVAEDADFLQPMAIRGCLEDGTITTFTDATSQETSVAEAPAAIEPAPAPAMPRIKRHARRAPPLHVAEATPMPELPEPNFLEKLFGTRQN